MKYLNAAWGKNTETAPIWIMRQAGRYLPEYRKIRKKHGFLEMMKTPELAAEVTLQPIRRYKMDAAILFSDILVTAEALGCRIDFIEGVGPVIEPKINEEVVLKTLSTSHTTEKLHYVQKAIQAILPQLSEFKIPLIGFAGTPFTVAAYMIEGKASKDLKACKTLFLQRPDLAQNLLDKLCTVTIDYLSMQIESGVSAIQLFDTWAAVLSVEDYRQYSYLHIQKITHAIHKKYPHIPITLFSKNSLAISPLVAELPIQVFSIDWQSPISQVQSILGPNIGLQGNLDPMTLYAPRPILIKKTQALLQEMQNCPNHIFNLGHGMLPDMDPDQLHVVVDTVRQFQRNAT